MKKIKYTLVAIAFGLVVSGCASGDEEQTTYEKIVDDKVITVATEGTYAPFSYYEDDKLVGYDVEIIEAVAQELGVEVKFVETKWDGIIAGLDASKYDIVANQVGITEEREEKYLFSTPYTYSQGVIIVPEDNTEITSFEDLEGKKSAQTITSNWAKIAEEYGAEIVGTEGFDQSVSLVTQGRADATVNDNVTYLDYIKNKPDAGVKIAATSDEVSRTAFLIRSDDKDLQEAINDALKKLEDEGVLKEISEKYFGKDISTQAGE